MIVGIGSIAQVGKDTAALALCRDLSFRRLAFADTIKDLAFEADPQIVANAKTNVGIGHGHLKWIVQSVGGWEQAKNQFPEVRRFLQNLGLGARKCFGDDFWLNQTMAQAARSESHVVIPDVRFKNEFDAIRASGGMLIRVNRPGRVGQGHVSETELLAVPDSDWDAIVDNDQSIVDLESKIVALVRQRLNENERPSFVITDSPLRSFDFSAPGVDSEIRDALISNNFQPLGAGSEDRVEH